MKNYDYNCHKSSSGLKMFRYTLSSSLRSFRKILVLSDLHIFSENDLANMDMIIEELKIEKYDAILLVGDITDQTKVLSENEAITNRLLSFIANLGVVAPTYIVYGNHDLGAYSLSYKKHFGTPWLDEYSIFKEKLNDVIGGYNGVHILDNVTEHIEDGFTISGVNPSIDYVTADSNGAFDKIIDKIDLSFLSNLNSSDINILLCHYPNVIFELHKMGLLNNIDLCVSGHNHNGCSQLKFFPVEEIFNLLGMKNRGFITPSMSLKFRDTKNLRGVVELDERTNLLINPCIKTFSATGNKLELLDGLFYKGATSIEFVPEKEFVLKPKNSLK